MIFPTTSLSRRGCLRKLVSSLLSSKSGGLQEQCERGDVSVRWGHPGAAQLLSYTEILPLQNQQEASHRLTWMTNNFLDEAGNSGASAPTVTVSASIVRYLRNKDRFVSLAGLHYKLNTSVTESLPQPLTDESFINQISGNRIAQPFYCVKQWLMPFKLMETIHSFSKIALPCPCSKEQKLMGSAGAQASCVHGPGRMQSSLTALRRWPVTLHALMCLYNGVQHHLSR